MSKLKSVRVCYNRHSSDYNYVELSPNGHGSYSPIFSFDDGNMHLLNTHALDSYVVNDRSREEIEIGGRNISKVILTDIVHMLQACAHANISDYAYRLDIQRFVSGYLYGNSSDVFVHIKAFATMGTNITSSVGLIIGKEFGKDVIKEIILTLYHKFDTFHFSLNGCNVAPLNANFGMIVAKELKAVENVLGELEREEI